MKKIALASRMGQITDPDYMGAKKNLTPNPENWIKLSGLFRNYIGPDSATTALSNPMSIATTQTQFVGSQNNLDPRPQTPELGLDISNWG